MDGQTCAGQVAGMIRLDLETEDGKKQEIFLDDKDFIRPGMTDKLKASEALVALMQEDAKQRRKELEQILTEHEEIVKLIVRQLSTDSNVEFQSSENSDH